MEKLSCIVLAAGLGKRMGGDLPKAIVKTREKTLIEHVLESASTLNPDKTIVVVGHKRALVEEAVKSNKAFTAEFALQDSQQGTGHAVKCALKSLENFNGTVLILYADTPLIKSETLKNLLAYHAQKKAALTFLSFYAPYPSPYGRVVRNKQTAEVMEIVEARDCLPDQVIITEVNSGIIAVDSAFLRTAVASLTNNNSQGEYYLTDVVSKAVEEKRAVAAISVSETSEALGVNTPSDLAAVNRELELRQVRKLVADSVSVVDPNSLFIDATVSVATGTKIGPNVQLRGDTVIQEGVEIEGSSIISDSKIGKNVIVKFGCRIESSEILDDAAIGPFAHLRPGSHIGSHARVGNFVETKNTKMATGAKASHLTYLGDCLVGKDANIGAGTITCNYDGYNKSTTTIGERVFIGSNSSLVAPVNIGDGATVGAGSVITKNVEPDALAFTRPALTVRADWSKKKRTSSKKSHT